MLSNKQAVEGISWHHLDSNECATLALEITSYQYQVRIDTVSTTDMQRLLDDSEFLADWEQVNLSFVFTMPEPYCYEDEALWPAPIHLAIQMGRMALEGIKRFPSIDEHAQYLAAEYTAERHTRLRVVSLVWRDLKRRVVAPVVRHKSSKFI